ncbi:MAG TPA: class E sortase [Actinomycetes bacterium]|nr:class E sortase [Actinomycetes bacterium]
MSAVRTATRGVGELFVTAGLVLLLFVTYQLVWTNFEANRAQDGVSDQIRDDWQRPAASGRTGAVGRVTDFGEGFAFMHIPRLGRRYSVPVVEGVSLDDLAKGVGHYPKTVLPGEVGNFAVAGHRATHGEPFAYLDEVRKGDAVVVETQEDWYVYVIDRTKIVQPTDTWVIEPVPGRPDAVPTERLITLTTCNPRWASTERLIVWGHLDSRRSKAAGQPAELRADA